MNNGYVSLLGSGAAKSGYVALFSCSKGGETAGTVAYHGGGETAGSVAYNGGASVSFSSGTSCGSYSSGGSFSAIC